MKPARASFLVHATDHPLATTKGGTMLYVIRATLLGLGVLISATLLQAQTPTLSIPKALQVEHHELFEALEKATAAGGKTGEAAKRAMAILKPHFEKEERYALPQLGALDALTQQGGTIPSDLHKDLIARADKFRAELPAMLEEHKKISASLQEMEKAAEQEKKENVVELAKMIIGHAGMEEQVLYPASLLVGEYAKRAGAVR